jgi:hypothetical protein
VGEDPLGDRATVAELNAVGPAGAKAATGLQSATKWAGRAAIAFVGLEVAGAVFDQLGNSAVNVNKLTAALQDYATTGKMTQGVTDEFGANLDDLSLIAQSAEAATHGFWKQLNDLTSTVPGVSSVVDSMNESITGTSFNDATDKMKALDESFTAFIGTQKDAKKAGELWNEILLKSGLDTEQLQALLPNTTTAMASSCRRPPTAVRARRASWPRRRARRPSSWRRRRKPPRRWRRPSMTCSAGTCPPTRRPWSTRSRWPRRTRS